MVPTMAVHAPAIPRADVWHGRFGGVIALGLVILPFVALLLWAITLPVPSEASIGEQLASTAGLLDDHAAAMTRAGEALAAAATTSTASDRDRWIGHGQRLAAEGGSIRALAERLRSTAASLDPLRQSSSFVGGTSVGALAAYASRWQAVRAEALATADHGRAMASLGADLDVAVGRGLLSAGDAAAVRAAASAMISAGDELVRTADMQLAAIERMQRGMGITPQE